MKTKDALPSRHSYPDNSSYLQGLSFRDYLKSELRRGYLLENDEERYTARREKVYTFFKIPREIEKFVAYGFFQCADSFFFMFTFLPIRFTLAIIALVSRPFRWCFGHRLSISRHLLKPAEIVDLMKGIMLIFGCYVISYIDTSIWYHIIKTQSTIKLYLFFNMLEIADRLMCSFGQDTLDALFWTATEPRGRKREHFGVVFHLLVAMVYVALHSTIVLLQALTLNVAINSDNKGLLAIVISNNFVELKGAVFKKFDCNNLLQISCNDIRERFHNCVLLLVVVIQTMKEYSWKEERFWILVPDCLLVSGTEILIDWLKHAFITRFNDIPAEIYKDYTVLLASDLIMCKQKYAYSDHSDLVARRMGFIPLPLGVVMYRILSQSIRVTNPAAYLLVFLGFLCLLSFRVLNGVVILGKGCDIIQNAENHHTRRESASQERKEKLTMVPITKLSSSPARHLSGCTEAQDGLTPVTLIPIFPSSASNSLSDDSIAAEPFRGAPDHGSSFVESRRGLMANSMVNLSSVGINEGPYTSNVSRQYRQLHSIDSNGTDISDISECCVTSPVVNSCSTGETVEVDRARVEVIFPSGGGKSQLEEVQASDISSRVRLISGESVRHRHPSSMIE